MPAISKIIIDGFKAFPNSFTLELEGKNLLMYGENGSGKSSIYDALRYLFQSQCKEQEQVKKDFNFSFPWSFVNKQTNNPYASVTIAFEGSDVEYSISQLGYKESIEQPTSPVRDLNGQCVFINHKFLFHFFSFWDAQWVDLFPVFKNDILPYTLLSDGSLFINQLYEDIMSGIKRKGKGTQIDDNYKRQIAKFNNELKQIIDRINENAIPNASDIYNRYFRNEDDPKLNITLEYTEHENKVPIINSSYWLRIGYRYENIVVAGETKPDQVSKRQEILQPIIPLYIREILDDGSERIIPKPQSYFNEAKLTAIALSIRFALLDIVAAANGRFMALDDMLISLDMGNRMKVVDYLLGVVADKYKIYLFTHDKNFFEYFMHKSKKSSSQWIYKEIYMQEDKEPFLRESKTYLGNADFFIKQHEFEIAGNFLRKEAESFCKEFLPKKLHFSADYSQLDLCGLIGNCKRFAEESGISDIFLFEELDDQRKFILDYYLQA